MKPNTACELIGIDEATQISEFAATLNEMEWAYELMKHYMKNPPNDGGDFRWTAGVVISTAFVAGRVQGIRDERKGRRHSQTMCR